uniref:Uncharacterized protein n=1 Tax=Cacopsylla melanoneura TaxID=428564 RepID=A0A8D8TUB0_9HEMI
MSVLPTIGLCLLMSLSLLIDEYAGEGKSTVPLEHKNIPEGEGLGRYLPENKREKLCGLNISHMRNLCKDCLMGTPDFDGLCANMAHELGFKIGTCTEIVPDLAQKSEKYNVCGLANKYYELADPKWYYVTSKVLTSHAVEMGVTTCKTNGLHQLIVKKDF